MARQWPPLHRAPGASKLRAGRLFGGAGGSGSGESPPIPFSMALQRISLTDALKLALDWGDINSWPGSGQKWLDTSSLGHDFFLGADGDPTATDPTPRGTAGGLSAAEYPEFDGGDRFTYDTTSEAWMDAVHQDGAEAAFLFWVWIGAIGSAQGLIGNNAGSGASVGFMLNITAAGVLQFNATTGAPGTALQQSSALPITAGAWHCLGMILREGVGITWFVDGLSDTDTANYSSPSASAASQTLQIGTRGQGNSPLSANSRLPIVAAWQGTGTPTLAQFTAVFNATRGRFGI